MLTITMKIPRQQNSYIHYTGDANSFLDKPIIVNENIVGTITRILLDCANYIEIEGVLFRAGADYFDRPEGLVPADVTILSGKDDYYGL